jgi:Domain of unknown function (DU1801)
MPNTKSPKVDKFLAGLVHGRKDEIESLRDAILSCATMIAEQVKWNAPSFCHDGDDRVTFRLQPGDRVELIFHRGVKKRIDSAAFAFTDATGFMRWLGPDRAVVVLADRGETDANTAAIVALIESWMAATRDE